MHISAIFCITQMNTADAEKYLTNALALDANSVPANTSYGLVKMRQRKFAEAKTFLEKAIAGDAKNHYAHYNYALRSEPRRYG